MMNSKKSNRSSAAKKTKTTKKTGRQIQKKEIPPDPEKLAELKKYEKVIREGIIKYYETGALLQKIRDEKLFELRGCDTFSEYCKKTFNFGRAYGYRLIAYCRVWNLIKANDDDKIPERVVRSLSMLKTDEEIRQCWEEAKEKAGDALPRYKEIDELVKEKKRLSLMEAKQFDPNDKEMMFFASIRTSVSKEDVAAGIIEASGSSFRKIYNSIKEAQDQGVSFTKADEKKLREALIGTLDSVFKKQ